MKKKNEQIFLIVMALTIIIFISVINPRLRYSKYAVNSTMWNNIIERRKDNHYLRINSMKFNGYSLIIDNTDRKLYYSVINEDKNKYNPLVIFKTTDKNAKLAILRDDITKDKVRFNHEFQMMVYNDSQYAIYKLICTDVPMLNIITKSDDLNSGEIFLFDNLTNKTNRVIMSDAKIDKDGDIYKISLEVETQGKNVSENKVSLFNMFPQSNYILEPAKRTTKGNILEMFVNNSYIGLYKLERE